MTEVTKADRDAYAPCPTCHQYSHSIGEDRVTAAFRHFQSMASHRGDGIPTQDVFDEQTRDHAQVLVAEIERLRDTRNLAYGLLWSMQPIDRHRYKDDLACRAREQLLSTMKTQDQSDGISAAKRYWNITEGDE